MTRTAHRLATATLAFGLLVAAAGCGSSGGGSDSADTTATTAMADGSGSDTTAADAGSDTTEPTGTAGTGTVTLADGEADAAKTVTYTDDGGFDPSELSVAVGELFTFKSGDDGVHAVKFGEATDTYTISGGLIESFTIDAAGTYTVTEDISGATMTVTVTG